MFLTQNHLWLLPSKHNSPLPSTASPLGTLSTPLPYRSSTMEATSSIPNSKPMAASSVPGVTGTDYPQAFQSFVQGRRKAKLGDLFGLANFGVNYTTLVPGAASALAYHHTRQDEFVYILQGVATLQLGDCVAYEMKAGDCMGFPAGDGVAHCIRNRSDSTQPLVFLEVGDRTPGDAVDYPGVDLKLPASEENDGTVQFTHKDGLPYDE